MLPLQVAVCGPRDATPTDRTNARRIGQLLAQAGATVICGGGVGVMEEVAAGAREHDGLVIGIRPNNTREGANEHLSAVIVTGMGEARNNIIVLSADVVIVVGGSWGTLSELALALRQGKPAISIGGWNIADLDGSPVSGVLSADTPEDVVRLALGAVE